MWDDMSGGLAANGKSGLSVAFVDVWCLIVVWLVVDCSSLVTIDYCRAISLSIDHLRSIRAIDRHLFIIHTKSVPVSIRVRKQPTLEHFVVRRLNAWYEMAWGKG